MRSSRRQDSLEQVIPREHHSSSVRTLQDTSSVNAADIRSTHSSSDETQPLLLKANVLSPGAPPDRFKLALSIFFVMGVGMLFPWNVFITAHSFFHEKFTPSPFSDNFESFFSIAYNGANVVTLFFLMRFIERLSTSIRVYSALIPTLIIFILITCLVKVTIDPSIFFALILAFVVISGIAVGFLQNGIFSLSAKFPFAYTAACMSGQGMAGLAVSVSQILTILASTDDESNSAIELSAILYFTVAIVVILLSIVGYVVLVKLPFFKYHNSRREDKEKEEQTEPEGEPNEFVDNSWAAQYEVLKLVGYPAFAVCFNFTVTLAIFPTVISLIEPCTKDNSSRIFGDLFLPFAFFLFNFGDLFGRVLAGEYPIRFPFWLAMVSSSRAIFFFFFLCSNVVLKNGNGEPLDIYLPRLFLNDYVYWFLILIFAVSNGYIASNSMMIGPSLVQFNQKEKAGSIMITFLVLGLCLGSSFSFVLRAILCRCDPFSS